MHARVILYSLFTLHTIGCTDALDDAEPTPSPEPTAGSGVIDDFDDGDGDATVHDGPALEPLLDESAPDAAPPRPTRIGTQAGPHALWRIATGLQDAAALDAVLIAHRDAGHDIDAIATTSTGHWVVVAGGDQDYSAGFPLSPSLAINSFLASGDTIRAIDFNANGGWVVVGTDSYLSGGALPAGVLAQLDWYQDTKNWTVRELEITNTGYLILGPGSTATYSNLDSDLAAVIADRTASGRRVQAAEIGFDGRWAVVSDQAPATENVSVTLANRLRTSAANEAMVSRLHVGPGDSYVVYSHGAVQPDLTKVAERLEYDIGGTSDNLWSRMAAAGVPGLQIAIVQGNQVVSARSYGVLKTGEQRPVIAKTPFDLASLSKFISSLVMVRLWSQGEFDIDTNILTAPGANVAWWQAIGEDQPDAFDNFGIPDLPLPGGMTIRRLLTHRSGLWSEGGSPSTPSAHWDDLPIPTIALLLGYTCSSSSNPCSYTKNKYVWTSGAAPGGPPVYSNGNFMLAMAIAEDATGLAGHLLLQDLLDDLGLVDTSGAAPLAASFEARAAWQHGTNGAAASSRTVYPWTFAGGIHASARDYAKLLILALNQGRDAAGVQRISASHVGQMLVGNYGAGFGLFFGGTTAAEGTDQPFNHAGSHGGRAYTRMCGHPTRDEGIVILSNAESTAARDLLDDLMDEYVAARGWPLGGC